MRAGLLIVVEEDGIAVAGVVEVMLGSCAKDLDDDAAAVDMVGTQTLLEDWD